MTFTATHVRAVTGSDITVTVTSDAKNCIASVNVVLDGMDLESQELADGTESYSRTFAHAGSSSPGMDHTLVVTAVDAGGTPHSATTRWND